MSSLGIPVLSAPSCGGSGIINLSWTDTPPISNAFFTVFGGDGTGLIDTTVKSSVKQWILNNSLGTVVWSVSGVGASIDQSGNLTTTALACGTIIVTATDSCLGAFVQNVRVTDAGAWFLQSTDNSGRTAYRNCTGNQGASYTDFCEKINATGNTKTRYEWRTETSSFYYGLGVCPNIYYTCGLPVSMINNPCTGAAFYPPPACGVSPAIGGYYSWVYVLFSTYTYAWCCPGGC